MKTRICIYMPDFGQDYSRQIKELEEAGFEVVWKKEHAQTQDSHVLIDDVKGYNCVIAASENWGSESLDGVADSLKLIARHGVGVDNIDIPYATKKGIAVTSAPGQLSLSVAEAALALTLSCIRRITKYDREIRGGLYHSVMTSCLSGKTFGLLGFGAIAQELARLLQPFHCRLLAYDVFPNQETAKKWNVEMVELDILCRESDVISLHIPCNHETQGMINKEFLSKMKPTSFLINTSRGGVIVEEELCQGLEEGVIAGAGLDVFATEHTEQQSVLFACENAILNPHSAANTKEALGAIMDSCVRSIKAFFSGEAPFGLLNPEYKEYVR